MGTPGEGGSGAAARDGGYPEGFDLETYFLHDVDPEVAAAGEPYQRDEADMAARAAVPLRARLRPEIETTSARGPRRPALFD